MPQMVIYEGQQILVKPIRRGSLNTRVRNLENDETFLMPNEVLIQSTIQEAQRNPEVDVFEVMAQLTKCVAENYSQGMFIAGPGGTGKTFTVMQVLADLGMVEGEHFVKVTGHSSALGMYNMLYENSDKLIVFDDCDNVFKDPQSLGILKSVLDTLPRRTVSWISSSTKVATPRFTFTGRIIFISNIEPEKVDSPHIRAMLTRVLTVIVGGSREEMLERVIALIPTIMDTADRGVHRRVEIFIRENQHRIRDLSLRFLKHINSLYQFSDDWQDLAMALN